MPIGRRKTRGDRGDQFGIQNRIAAILLTVPDDEMYGKVMDVVREVSESPFGIFAYIDDDGSVVAPSLARDTGEDTLQSERPIRFSRDSWGDTVWGAAIRERRSVISNQPCGILHGYIPITRTLVTPVLFNNTVLGYLKVANRPTDYTDRDRKDLEKIAGFIALPLHARLERNRRERKQQYIEDKLKQSKHQLTTVMSGLPGMAYQCLNDLDWTMMFASEGCKRLTGYEPEAFISGRIHYAFLIHHHDVGRVWEEIRGKLQRKLPFESIYRIRTEDSGDKWVWEQGRGLYTPDGSLIAVESFVTDISDIKQTEEESRKAYSQMKALAAQLQAVREEERKKLAHELHDELGQTLAGLRFDLFWLLKKIPGKQTELKDKIKTMMDYIEPAISKVRRMYTELRPWILDELGLIDAIEWQVDALKLRSCLPLEFETHFDLDEQCMTSEEKTALFRITQEALLNILTHAEASRVSISLAGNSGGIRLRIQDNGKGLLPADLKKAGPAGILIMRERVAALGGQFEIKGNPGKGTVLTADIPGEKSALRGRDETGIPGRLPGIGGDTGGNAARPKVGVKAVSTTNIRD